METTSEKVQALYEKAIQIDYKTGYDCLTVSKQLLSCDTLDNFEVPISISDVSLLLVLSVLFNATPLDIIRNDVKQTKKVILKPF